MKDMQDIQYIIQAIEEQLKMGAYYQKEMVRLIPFEKEKKELSEALKVREAQLEEAEKRIGELEEALRRLKDGGVKRC